MKVILGALSKLLAGELLIDKNPLTLIQELDLKGQKIEEDFWQLLKMHFCGQTPSRKYIERVDEQAFNQPYLIKGVDMYGFLLNAKCYKLQEICDKYLNIGSSKFYCPAAPYVVLTINNIESLQSINSPDSEKGYVTEQEAIFWVPVLMGTKVGLLFKPERLVWFMAYLFVNNSPVLVSGREIFGFPKQIATFTFPSQPGETEPLSVDTLVFKKFFQNLKAEEARIIEVKTKKSLNDQTNSYEDPAEFLADMVNNLKINQVTIPNFDISLDLISGALGKAVNIIGLKEFRDIEDSSTACYKAIVYTPMRVTNFSRGTIIKNSLVKIHNYASHRICQELGLSNSDAQVAEITPSLSFYINFDFQVDNGKVLWEEGWQKRWKDQETDLD
ncbi:hypothetical protein [Cylindrospermum sp. FACHB-282]|uniref:hypothetical protein n=1 Tax=Cylindrospermum sp. FACHB-282 TaxID=2692794 RepID=UPI0016821641|nr:hypothetical protein [Cylindrospermum sp. FACHB-282]MBD2385100.1 hypothetical protein [Cylindrospermum sp. FACHB-282]